jgi:hypothetical protein
MKETSMSEFIQQLIERTGLNEQQARQVEQFLRENAAHLPSWLSVAVAPETLKSKLGGLLRG